MSSDIRLEEDQVTVEGKLNVDDGASIRGDVDLSGPRILGATKIAGLALSPPTQNPRPRWEDVIEISPKPSFQDFGGGAVVITVGDTPKVQNSILVLKGLTAQIHVGFGDSDAAYTKILNNMVIANDFIQHENGSLVEKIKELEEKNRQLEDRIQELERAS